ncbi:hypothetical protein EJ06DRAFT_556454 [Trichodelitschia bisporula]|uniref:Uncharacterized protein n=1 Tax=Trichodelitschia bisporula TaxID=703511 RepID=A0A6G1HZ28_9PEZI|nr:hypothetical protein EJ06DRAFT_556454 [Trichodelitschia bisporula]
MYPADYTGCKANPDAGTDRIVLQDAASGLEIVNQNNTAVVSPNGTDPNTFYTFSRPPNAPCGVYDLVYNSPSGSAVLAIFPDEHLGFVPTSSDGQNSDDYITTVWSIDCDGTLRAGIIDGAELFFGVPGNGATVFAQGQPVGSALEKRRAWSKLGRKKERKMKLHRIKAVVQVVE